MAGLSTAVFFSAGMGLRFEITTFLRLVRYWYLELKIWSERYGMDIWVFGSWTGWYGTVISYWKFGAYGMVLVLGIGILNATVWFWYLVLGFRTGWYGTGTWYLLKNPEKSQNFAGSGTGNGIFTQLKNCEKNQGVRVGFMWVKEWSTVEVKVPANIQNTIRTVIQHHSHNKMAVSSPTIESWMINSKKKSKHEFVHLHMRTWEESYLKVSATKVDISDREFAC